jgi:hypothetical protein
MTKFEEISAKLAEMATRLQVGHPKQAEKLDELNFNTFAADESRLQRLMNWLGYSTPHQSGELSDKKPAQTPVPPKPAATKGVEVVAQDGQTYKFTSLPQLQKQLTSGKIFFDAAQEGMQKALTANGFADEVAKIQQLPYGERYDATLQAVQAHRIL